MERRRSRRFTMNSSSTKFEISQAKIEDTNILVAHRLDMFTDMHPELTKEIQASKEQTGEWLRTDKRNAINAVATKLHLFFGNASIRGVFVLRQLR